jgi:hypothetical protein
MKQALTTIGSLLFSSSLHHSSHQRKLLSKRRFVLLLAGVMLLVSSCRKEDHDCKKTVPFKAEFITADVITDTANLPGNPIQKDHITGTGEGTSIGKATLEAFIVSDLTTPFVNGNEIITAANGDKIFMSNTGSVTGPDSNNNIHATLDLTISGGTGRFAGATGSLTGLVTQSIITPAGTLSLAGAITLDECHVNKPQH